MIIPKGKILIPTINAKVLMDLYADYDKNRGNSDRFQKFECAWQVFNHIYTANWKLIKSTSKGQEFQKLDEVAKNKEIEAVYIESRKISDSKRFVEVPFYDSDGKKYPKNPNLVGKIDLSSASFADFIDIFYGIRCCCMHGTIGSSKFDEKLLAYSTDSFCAFLELLFIRLNLLHFYKK